MTAGPTCASCRYWIAETTFKVGVCVGSDLIDKTPPTASCERWQAKRATRLVDDPSLAWHRVRSWKAEPTPPPPRGGKESINWFRSSRLRSFPSFSMKPQNNL